MASIYAKLGMEEPKHMPSCPDAAVVIAGLFSRLHGTLHIDHNGKRHISMPVSAAFDMMDGSDRLPDPVPNPKPHERFTKCEEFEGALKMIAALIRRLHPDDLTLIYDSFAQVSTPDELEEARKVQSTPE